MTVLSRFASLFGPQTIPKAQACFAANMVGRLLKPGVCPQKKRELVSYFRAQLGDMHASQKICWNRPGDKDTIDLESVLRAVGLSPSDMHPDKTLEITFGWTGASVDWDQPSVVPQAEA